MCRAGNVLYPVGKKQLQSKYSYYIPGSDNFGVGDFSFGSKVLSQPGFADVFGQTFHAQSARHVNEGKLPSERASGPRRQAEGTLYNNTVNVGRPNVEWQLLGFHFAGSHRFVVLLHA